MFPQLISLAITLENNICITKANVCSVLDIFCLPLEHQFFVKVLHRTIRTDIFSESHFSNHDHIFVPITICKAVKTRDSTFLLLFCRFVFTVSLSDYKEGKLQFGPVWDLSVNKITNIFLDLHADTFLKGTCTKI